MRFGPVEHLFRTLRFQLTFWNTIVILVLVSAALWGVREGLRWTLLTELDKALAEDVEEVRLTVEGYYPNKELIGEELDRRRKVTRIAAGTCASSSPTGPVLAK